MLLTLWISDNFWSDLGLILVAGNRELRFHFASICIDSLFYDCSGSVVHFCVEESFSSAITV